MALAQLAEQFEHPVERANILGLTVEEYVTTFDTDAAFANQETNLLLIDTLLTVQSMAPHHRSKRRRVKTAVRERLAHFRTLALGEAITDFYESLINPKSLATDSGGLTIYASAVDEPSVTLTLRENGQGLALLGYDLAISRNAIVTIQDRGMAPFLELSTRFEDGLLTSAERRAGKKPSLPIVSLHVGHARTHGTTGRWFASTFLNSTRGRFLIANH